MANQEDNVEGIYYIKGEAGRSFSEAQAAGDISRVATGLTIDEWGLAQVVIVMNENSDALEWSKRGGYICWFDGQKQWSLKEMKDRLAAELSN
ncbi:hypothetical protein GWQ29_01565 [Aeromonas sp. 2HA2]|uniref:hypothetical protein n=1 Tax=Aeromonas sp. 2HA2 TaxID=2699194 RepID=UPI0023DD700B|nr:hypothetical protein [Aeromonas sp. 2HA2]MDF2408129.1 hypothetical protein [Aeromonas sp. 2HA2]